ncbi:MAG: hypothetical protein GY822_18355 [Deltaproteobacteria bacterium]|nr:hypothetical protein [Deltaproteobacteria bacterium]
MESSKYFHIFRLKTSWFPTNAEGLNILSSTAHGEAVMPCVPFDPWGRPYLYRIPGKHYAFDVVSAGPDRIYDTEDDIGNWDRDL